MITIFSEIVRSIISLICSALVRKPPRSILASEVTLSRKQDGRKRVPVPHVPRASSPVQQRVRSILNRPSSKLEIPFVFEIFDSNSTVKESQILVSRTRDRHDFLTVLWMEVGRPNRYRQIKHLKLLDEWWTRRRSWPVEDLILNVYKEQLPWPRRPWQKLPEGHRWRQL